MKISVQQEDFDLGLEVLDIQQDNSIGIYQIAVRSEP